MSKLSSFFYGLFSLLAIFPPRREYPKMTLEEAFEADRKAIESDWEAVMNDFQIVWNRMPKEFVGLEKENE